MLKLPLFLFKSSKKLKKQHYVRYQRKQKCIREEIGKIRQLEKKRGIEKGAITEEVLLAYFWFAALSIWLILHWYFKVLLIYFIYD